MRGIAILIIILLAIWIFGPPLSRWLKRKAMEKTADYLWKQMGMPPREKDSKNKGRGKRKNSEEETYGGTYYYKRNTGRGRRSGTSPVDMMRSYAEEVEFTESVDYSSEKVEKSTSEVKAPTENQVSDAEWQDLKNGNNKSQKK